jgi:hypothetical protein
MKDVSMVHHTIKACCVVLLFASTSVSASAQDRLGAGRGGVARELSANEAPHVLDLPRSYLESLQLGKKGATESTAPKERLNTEALTSFVEQFGRLPNDMPTIQIAPGKYFVLIPLGELEKQPPPPKGGPLARTDRSPSSAQAEGGSAAVTVVDHRRQESPVRNQGDRGACVAFAACADLEHMLRKADPASTQVLSTNLAYFWFMKEEQSTPCKDPGLATYKAAEYLTRHYVCAEGAWPYVSTDPVDLSNQHKCNLIDVPPAGVATKQGWGIKSFLLLPQGTEVTPNGSIDIRDTDTLERLLNEGHDIVFGTIVAWRNTDAAGIIDVRLGPAGQPIFGAGGHALVMVGYRKPVSGPDTRPYFIVKNSWGTDYGHDGYLYMTYDYIRTYARYGYCTNEIQQAIIGPTN